MAYDIYGDNLKRGHCEVHPWVDMEYPCPVCLDESRSREQEEVEYQKYCDEQYDQYCKEMVASIITDSFTTA